MKETYYNKKKENVIEKDISIKAFMNELKMQFGREEFDCFEVAKIIDYLKREKGISMRELARQLGVHCNKIIKLHKVLDCNAETMKKIKEGKINPINVGRVLFSLKDPSDENIIIDQVIADNLNSDEIATLTAEYNKKESFGTHLKKVIRVFSLRMDRELKKEDFFDSIETKTKTELIRGIEDLEKTLVKIKSRVK